MARQGESLDWSDIPDLDPEKRTDAVGNLIKARADDLGITIEELRETISKKTGLPKDTPAEEVYDYLAELVVREAKAPYPYVSASGTVIINTAAVPFKPTPMIMLVETYALSSFLGDYGAGKTIKTFTLLPNEKTKISIKTWKTTETTSKQASTVLDAWTRDTSTTFENNVRSETSEKTDLTKVTSFNAQTTGEGHFNVAIWGVKGTHEVGYKENWNDSRQNFAQNISSATDKHVANASAKRNVEVNTSFEAKTVTGEEQTITREIENINAGRVLNFVFRQLNQEYITYLHLIDIKLAFANGKGGSPYLYKEFRLNEMEDLLDYCLRDAEQGEHVSPKDKVREIIINELTSMADYKGTVRHDFIECVDLTTGKTKDSNGNELTISDYLKEDKRVDTTSGKRRLYIRVKRDTGNSYKNDPDVKHNVDGIIMAIDKHILPTDSVIVDALLGQAEALDKYSQDSRKAVIDQKQTEIEKTNLANQIVRNKDGAQADIFAKVYPPQIYPPLVKVEEKATTEL